MRNAQRGLVLVMALAVLVPAAACVSPSTSSSTNPFFTEWSTPFGVPPFDQIHDEHFRPAFDKAIADRTAEVEAVAATTEPPTFANTVEALDQGGELLERVTGVFFNLVGAETNDALQEIATEVAPRLAALEDSVLLNQELFQRIKTVYEQREELGLDAQQLRLLEETHRRFVRGGAELASEQRQRLQAVNQELAQLGVAFSDNNRRESNAYELLIEDEADLAGLPASVVAAAAEAAAAAGHEGAWMFTLQAPSIWPFLTYADNRDLRQQILTAYLERGRNSDEFDNRETLAKIVALRAEKAQLLGYETWAHYVLAKNMAEEPQRVYDLLRQLWEPALAAAREEAETLQALIRDEGHDFELAPWDWRYYAEKVRMAQFDVDEEVTRPYFELESVRDGAFWVANRLWGLSFTERDDIPTYHDEVRAFEVSDGDGSHLGILLVDYHPRPGKRSGAWMNEYRKAEEGVRPIVVNVGNFSRPTADAPALLRLEEVETLFHEFGHALHGLFAQVRYRGLNDGVPRDFVELPSQIMENWVLEPEVLRHYAHHYQTGEVIPDELIERIRRARRANQGFATVEYLAASFLDMDWHTLSAEETAGVDPDEFERRSLDSIGLIPEIPVRYRSPYFRHIFGGGGGYAAGYYSYIWSEVLDADAFQLFAENGIFDQATGQSFRDNILSRGNSVDALEMFVDFRGAEPSVEPLLERRGLDD